MRVRRPRWLSLDSAAFALAILTGLLVIGGIWVVSSSGNRRATAIAMAQTTAQASAQIQEMADLRRQAQEAKYLLHVSQARRALDAGQQDAARERLAAADIAWKQSGASRVRIGDEPPSHPEFEWRWLDRKLREPGSEVLARGSELKGPAPEEPAASLAFAPDGKSIALGLPDGRIVVRALPGSDLRWEASGGKHPVVGVAFSHDGNLLASVDRGGGVRILDAASGKDAHPPLALDQKESRGLLFDEHGTIHSLGAPLVSMKPGEPPLASIGDDGGGVALAATGADSPRFLMREGDGLLLLTASPADPGPADVPIPLEGAGLRCAAVSPDGSLVVASYLGQARLSLHENNPATKRWESWAAGGEVAALAFSPDGARAAVGDGRGGVALWAPSLSCEALALPPIAGPGEGQGQGQGGGPAAILGVAFSPDGNSLGAIDARGHWIVWDGAP